MRRPFHALLAVQIQANFTRRFNRDSASKSKAYPFLIGGLLLVLAGYYALLFFTLIPALVAPSATNPDGLGPQLFNLAVLAVQALTIFLGTYQVLHVVFLSRDIPVLAALPLSPRALFLSKLTIVYIYELITAGLLLLPLGVYIGAVKGYALLYYGKLLLLWLQMPAFPLAIAVVIALIITNISALTKRRDLVVILLSLLSMGIYVLTLLLFNPNLSELLGDISTNLGNVFDRLISLYEPGIWARKALFLRSGANERLHLLYFALLSVLSLYAAAAMAIRLYFKSALSSSESGQAHISRKHAAKRQLSPTLACARREGLLLLRTPIYFLNTFMAVLIFPLMLVLMFVFRQSYTLSLQSLNALRQSLSPALLIVATTAMLTYIGTLSNAAFTPFSREGRAFALLRSYPLPLQTQLKGKLLCAAGIGWATQSLLVISLIALFGFPLTIALPALLLSALTLLPAMAAASLPDCLRPKLRWSSEAYAMKNNLNALYAMGFLLPALLIQLGGIALLSLLTVPTWLFILVSLLWLLALHLLTWRRLLTIGAKALQKIEL